MAGGFTPQIRGIGGVRHVKGTTVGSTDVTGVPQAEDQSGTAESIDQTPDKEKTRYTRTMLQYDEGVYLGALFG